MIAYSSLMIFIYFNTESSINGFAAIIPAGLACGVGCLFVGYEETPCNVTINLLSKVISVLRLLIAVSAFLKVDHHTNWEWSTTFWPYWCSFAIQAIIGIASFIIFVNTILNYYREEAILEDSNILILIWYSLGCLLGFHRHFWLRLLNFASNYQHHSVL
jgi:hypothetical protein